jgi:hypothetical protein
MLRYVFTYSAKHQTATIPTERKFQPNKPQIAIPTNLIFPRNFHPNTPQISSPTNLKSHPRHNKPQTPSNPKPLLYTTTSFSILSFGFASINV